MGPHRVFGPHLCPAREAIRGSGHVICMAKSSRAHKGRPCSVCRKWFTPDPRVAGRQRTCGAACSKKLTQKRQAAWQKRNPDYEADRALRRKIDHAEKSGCPIEVRPGSQLARIPWRTVQTAIGVKQAVVLAFALRLLDRSSQTMMAAESLAAGQFPGRVFTYGNQTEMAGRPAGGDDSQDFPTLARRP